MSYDHWKTTNPDDEFLGPEPPTFYDTCPDCEGRMIFEDRFLVPVACKRCAGVGLVEVDYPTRLTADDLDDYLGAE